MLIPRVENDASATKIAHEELRIRILTLNLHKGFSAFNRKFVLPELKAAIHDVAADIVFLQEVLGIHAEHAERYPHWPDVSQYEYLADTIWTDFAYGKNAAYDDGHHGNAVLSKYPILAWSNRDASLSRGEKRGLLHCCMEVPRTRVRIHTICIHMSLRERDRQQQLDMLLDMIKTIPHDQPLIVAGDFNDWRLLGHRRLLHKTGLHEVFSSLNGGPAATFPARWPFLRLDRIYVRNVKIIATVPLPRRPWSHLSDHAPLVAEISIRLNQTHGPKT